MNSQALSQRALEIQRTLTPENVAPKAALLGWNRSALSTAAGTSYKSLWEALAGRGKLTPKMARKLSLALATREVEFYGSEPHCRRVLEILTTLTWETFHLKAALLGWNLFVLARAAGMNGSSLYLIANGRRSLTPKSALKIALAFADREAELGVTL